MPAAAESELRLGVSPSLDEVRALAGRGHNLVPVIQTYLEDCETPVSAFLKLRGPRRGTARRAARWASAAP